ERGGDRGVDVAQRRRRAGGVVLAAGLPGQLLEGVRREALALDADRVDRDVRLLRGRDGRAERRVAAGVVPVRQEDEDAAGEVLARQLLGCELDPVVQRRARLRVDREVRERGVGV